MKNETIQRLPGAGGGLVSATGLGRRPRVLVLEGASRVGGGQQVTLNTATALKDRVDFDVAVPGAGALEERLKAAGIESKRVGYPAPAGKFSLLDRALYLPRGIASLLPLILLIRRTTPELLYATSRTALWAVIAGRITGTPVAVHLHMIPPTGRTAWFLARVCSMQPVKKVMVASAAIAGRMSLPPEKVRVVPNGIQLPGIPARPELRSEVRSEFGLANTTHVAAVVGEISAEKGQLDAIEALSQMSDGFPEAALLLVGAARPGNERHGEQLRHRISKLGLDRRVILTGHHDDVTRLLSGVDLLLVPSAGASGEACPMAVLEAWAAGVAVLGANTGGLPEMLGQGRGALFDTADNQSLATQWERLAGDRIQLDALSRAGLEAAGSRYSLESTSGRILAALEEAMSG